MAVTSAQVQELYVAYLGRAADQAGLDYWMAELNAEPAVLTLENLRANFVNEQPEYAAIYGGLTREETVIQIYNNLFGRAPDAAGLEYWTTGGGASVNADQLLVAFIDGASPEDAKVVTNKVLVAGIYTELAGSNYIQADAIAAIADVDGTTASVSAAIAALNTLPSVAVPEAVALIQAAAVAADAVADFEASAANVDALKAVNDKVIALNADYGVVLTALVDGADEGTKVDHYSEVVATLANAEALRDAISADSTAVLTTKAGEAATELTAARTALVNGVTGALTAVKAFEAAYAADAALEYPATADVDLRTAQLQAVADNSVDVWNAAVAKLSAATLAAVGGAPVSADALYAYMAEADSSAAGISEVKAAFGAVEGFTAVADLAAQANAKDAAEGDLADAQADVLALEGTLDEDYLDAFYANVDAQEVLADAKAADVLVNDAAAIVASHDALVDASDDAAQAVVDSAATVAVAAGAGAADTAEVFFFGSKVDGTVRDVAGTDDVTINVEAGDSIVLGAGFTLNSTATYDAATDVITGGNNGVKEIFFVEDETGFQAVIETADLGSATAVTANANVAVITLAGVESLDQLSFANGMITIA